MAETSVYSVLARTQSDATAMKETLVAQQQLLQKLYAELDQEREASASAASEALDMILRLQGEKAAVKMEASHYKRMAEEKIGHAEATLEAFEELMYQKEMEIASLEFQVQAYKHKLFSMGCDFNASEFEFPEDLLLNRIDLQSGENSQGAVRRMHSMPPPIQFKNSLRVARRRQRSLSPVPVSDAIPKIVEEDNIGVEVIPPILDSKSKTGDEKTLDSYWNLIRKLGEKVKVISDCNEGEKKRASLSSSIRGRAPSINSDDGESNRDGKAASNPSSSLNNVHDVFEVPQTNEKQKVSEFGKNRLEKRSSEAENRLRKPDSSSAEGMVDVESHVVHEMEKQKGKVSIKTSGLKHMMTMIGQKKEGIMGGVDCSSTQAEFQKLNHRIERLERERFSTRRQQEITREGEGNGGEEQLRLLKDIESQLKLMQLEMSSWKPKRASSTPKDDDHDVSMSTLQEAMLHFWL